MLANKPIKLKTTLILVLILLASSSVLFQRFHAPFDRIDDVNSLIYAFYAKNMTRFSFSFHGLRNIDAVTPYGISQQLGIKNSPPFTYYLDHSPFLSILVASSFSIFGHQASSARLVPILSSLGTLIVFFHLVKSKVKTDQALLATFFLGSFSLFLEHGQIINFEPTTLFFITLAFYLFNRYFHQTKSKVTLILAFVIWYLAQLADWPAAFAGPAISFMFFKNGASKKLILFSFFFAFAGLATVVANYSFLSTEFFPYMLKVTIILPFIQPGKHGFNIFGFLNSQRNFYIINISLLPLIASLAWSYYFIQNLLIKAKIRFSGKSLTRLSIKLPSLDSIQPVEQVSLWFLSIGLANTVLFYEWARTHRFWMYYLLPFFAITTTIVVVKIASGKNKAKFLLPVLILVYSYQTTKNALRFIHNPAISSVNLSTYSKLNSQIPVNNVMFSNENIYRKGSGRRIRYYIDRPIYIAHSEKDAQNSGFSGQYWIVNNHDQSFINSLKGEKISLDTDFTLIKRK